MPKDPRRYEEFFTAALMIILCTFFGSVVIATASGAIWLAAKAFKAVFG